MNSGITSEPETSAQALATLVGVLLAIGTVMVFSSSLTAQSAATEQVYLSRHLLFAGLAGALGTVTASLPAKLWRKLAPLALTVTILLLIGVLIPGLGRTVNGAQRWFRIGTVSFQPSETAKLSIPLIICALRYPARGPAFRPSLSALIAICSLAAVTAVLIACEPDLGTACFVGIAAAVALYLSGWPLRDFVIGTVIVLPCAAALIVLKPYQLERIRGFLATWQHPESAPYQIQQSLTTLGVGGVHGTGLGRGWQKLSFLPEANTDFVFAVIGEELGLVGTLCVIALWGGVYTFGRRLICRVPRDSFESVAAATLLTILVLQAALNMAVVLALVPPKGISHPFISYGGEQSRDQRRDCRGDHQLDAPAEPSRLRACRRRPGIRCALG